MDIMVEGKASKFFKPDQVCINLTFLTKTSSYEQTLNEGTRDVQIFIDEILSKLGFNKEELKTRNFLISEKTRYDVDKKVYLKDGFEYSQGATLLFDYDMKRLAVFMEETAKLKNPPRYRISFMLKDEAIAKKEVTAMAYNNSYEKAKMISEAAGKELKDCIKIDFRPFEEKVVSHTFFEEARYEKKANFAVSDRIENIFTPSDIEVFETLYCLWLAE